MNKSRYFLSRTPVIISAPFHSQQSPLTQKKKKKWKKMKKKTLNSKRASPCRPCVPSLTHPPFLDSFLIDLVHDARREFFLKQKKRWVLLLLELWKINNDNYCLFVWLFVVVQYAWKATRSFLPSLLEIRSNESSPPPASMCQKKKVYFKRNNVDKLYNN
jgi:hypothetical protein